MIDDDDIEVEWDDAPRGEIQVRLLSISKKGNETQIQYQIAIGDEWSSGYDGRVLDELIQSVKETRCVSFIPVGVDLGWDGVEDIKISRPEEQDREICKRCFIRVECLSMIGMK